MSTATKVSRPTTYVLAVATSLAKNLLLTRGVQAGDGVWVEVDLLLDENTPLEHVHDVSETLQYCMEGLNEVDRAFVSVSFDHKFPPFENRAC